MSLVTLLGSFRPSKRERVCVCVCICVCVCVLLLGAGCSAALRHPQPRLSPGGRNSVKAGALEETISLCSRGCPVIFPFSISISLRHLVVTTEIVVTERDLVLRLS
jgi:hypothetical protein